MREEDGESDPINWGSGTVSPEGICEVATRPINKENTDVCEGMRARQSGTGQGMDQCGARRLGHVGNL